MITVKTVTVNSGLRAAELNNLCWSDADFDRPTVAVTEKPDWKPKDYEEREIPLNRTAVSALREHKLRRVVWGSIFSAGKMGESMAAVSVCSCAGHSSSPAWDPAGYTLFYGTHSRRDILMRVAI